MDVYYFDRQLPRSALASWIGPCELYAQFAVGEPCSAPKSALTVKFGTRGFEIAKRYDFISAIEPGPIIASSKFRALVSDLCPASAQWFQIDVLAGETRVAEHGFHALNVVHKASIIDLKKSMYESTRFGISFFTEVVLKNRSEFPPPYLFREECYPSFLLANNVFKSAARRAKLNVKFFRTVEDMGWIKSTN